MRKIIEFPLLSFTELDLEEEDDLTVLNDYKYYLRKEIETIKVIADCFKSMGITRDTEKQPGHFRPNERLIEYRILLRKVKGRIQYLLNQIQ